jgi:membrane fusion protein (multidrug efflux system)
MQGRRLVAVVKPDHIVEMRPVQVGEALQAGWVIEQGLRPGERVIVEGLQKARPGSKVDPRPYESAGAALGR